MTSEERMTYLCNCIQEERDAEKLTKLIAELNELLARKEQRLVSKPTDWKFKLRH